MLRNLFIFCVCLRASAPVLQTLTSSISDDTIYALVLFLSTIHIVFYDYSLPSENNSEEISISLFSSVNSSVASKGILSLNAAMFNAIVLASRLKSIQTVVYFCYLAVIFFYVFPDINKMVRYKSVNIHLLMTIFTYVITSTLLCHFDTLTIFIVYQVSIVFLWFFATLWLYHSQSSKMSLRGPWDEAKIQQ